MNGSELVAARYVAVQKQAEEIVAGVSPDQMELPTPCARWDVRHLINHLVGGSLRHAAKINRQPLPQRSAPADFTLGDLGANAALAGAAAVACWERPGALDERHALPYATVTGHVAREVHLLEVLLHTWDLATATGQTAKLDGALAEGYMPVAQRIIPDAIRQESGDPFGRVRRVPAGAGPYEILAAFAGREVAGRPAPRGLQP